jgi:hypothetical protein
MAATKRLSTRIDYAQLDNLSSVVLYDTSAPRKKKGKIDEVERIIGRKKEKHVSIKLKLPEFIIHPTKYNLRNYFCLKLNLLYVLNIVYFDFVISGLSISY